MHSGDRKGLGDLERKEVRPKVADGDVESRLDAMEGSSVGVQARGQRAPLDRASYNRFRVKFGIYNLVWLCVASFIAGSSLSVWYKALALLPFLIAGPTFGWLRSYDTYLARWQRRHGQSQQESDE